MLKGLRSISDRIQGAEAVNRGYKVVAKCVGVEYKALYVAASHTPADRRRRQNKNTKKPLPPHFFGLLLVSKVL